MAENHALRALLQTLRRWPCKKHVGYMFASGDVVRVVSGTFEGLLGKVSRAVFQMSYDYPDEIAPGYRTQLEDGKGITLRWDHVV